MLTRFEARELKPYAEPISAQDLREGRVYFSLTFVDDKMLIPTVSPLVFIGRDLEPGDHDQVYFQDIDSFNAGVRYPGEDDGELATFIRGPMNEINYIFDYEHMLDQLLSCALRRRESGELP